jgi:LysM repeat protein
MDTISRENNSSMLPVGGIIVGVVALLLSGYAAITLSKVNKSIAAHDEKLGKIESIETQVTTAAADAARANKAIGDYARQTQTGFDSVVGELSKFREEITKMQEAKKAPAPAPGGKAGGKDGTPAVAGPDEYVVKAGDSSGTKIAAARGISLADLQAVNPGVDWTKLKIGQKLKLPVKK